jgi:hypothetical protein
MLLGAPSTIWEEKNKSLGPKLVRNIPRRFRFSTIWAEKIKNRGTKKEFLKTCSRMVSSGGSEAVIQTRHPSFI